MTDQTLKNQKDNIHLWRPHKRGLVGGRRKDNNNIKKSKCLESKHVRYSRNFNYKTYRNLIISPLIVTTMITFTIYLLQLMANNDSLIYQKLIILKYCHKYQETPHLAFICSKSTLEMSNNVGICSKLTTIRTP